MTSAIYSPRLKADVGYCWVPVALAAEGTELRVATEWGDRTATVVPMPFVDPGKRVPESPATCVGKRPFDTDSTCSARNRCVH